MEDNGWKEHLAAVDERLKNISGQLEIITSMQLETEKRHAENEKRMQLETEKRHAENEKRFQELAMHAARSKKLREALLRGITGFLEGLKHNGRA